MCGNLVYFMFYVLKLGHIFMKSSLVICYNINKLTYLLPYLLQRLSNVKGSVNDESH